jgi:4-amino-4-deoxy-L-arabinose transferase-like glycosyltransferase
MELNSPRTRPWWWSDTALLAYLAFARVVLHLLSSFNAYGYFRDEFYYLACANHLDWGYVDHPPLSIWILAATRAALGSSAFAIRLPAVLAEAATVFLTGLIARELGGGRFAQWLSALAYLFMGAALAIGSLFSMNAFDFFFWAAGMWILARILRTDNPRLWVAFGAVAGLAMMNKISIGFFAFGVVAALLATPYRRHFLSRWIWIGAAIAFLIFLPHVLWQIAHGAPTLEWMSNARKKIAPSSPTDFVLGQLMIGNPFTAVVWLIGLAWLLAAKAARPYRALGLAYVVIVILMIVQQAKDYYLSPAYPMLYAAGGVAIERWAASRRRRLVWLKPALAAWLVAGGLLMLPIALPILPPEAFIRYTAAIRFKPTASERNELGELPQYLADRFGWEEMARTVASVYRSLAPEDRARCLLAAGNYGEAGALEFYAAKYGLPPVVCGHNNYWLWGAGDAPCEMLISVGESRERMLAMFEDVTEAARLTSRFAMPYETKQPILICRKPRKPLKSIWPEVKHFI